MRILAIEKAKSRRTYTSRRLGCLDSERKFSPLKFAIAAMILEKEGLLMLLRIKWWKLEWQQRRWCYSWWCSHVSALPLLRPPISLSTLLFCGWDEKMWLSTCGSFTGPAVGIWVKFHERANSKHVEKLWNWWLMYFPLFYFYVNNEIINLIYSSFMNNWKLSTYKFKACDNESTSLIYFKFDFVMNFYELNKYVAKKGFKSFLIFFL